MKKYKKLLVLVFAIDNLEGVAIPMNIIKECIVPLKEYINSEIEEIEKQKQTAKGE